MTQEERLVTNYDWQYEANHYRAEYEKLHELLAKVELAGERAAGEVYRLREALKVIAQEYESPSTWNSKPQKYFVSIARKALEEE